MNDPVTIECGHNFCRACLAPYWEGEEVSCPQCRKEVRRNLVIPNWQLANLAEKVSHLEGEKAQERNGMCVKHQEPIKLFCQDEETLICVVCNQSKEHRGHLVVPLEEAAPEYQELITNCLDLLKKERATIMKYKAEILKESQGLFKQTEAEMAKMKAEFRKLHQFLEEQEKLLLAQLKEVEKEIARKKEEHLARFSEELSSLQGLIQEMEKKRQQPPQGTPPGVNGSLTMFFSIRSEKKQSSENPVAFRPELKWKIWDFCDINPLLERVMNQFQATITLDPETAHPQLIVSEDRKSVTCGNRRQYLLDIPHRFDTDLIVLGKERFTAGRHFWEVVVGSEEQWLTGVTRESVERKGIMDWSPKGGILAVGKWGGGYRAISQPTFTPFSPGDDLKRIRVSLNCAAGRVAFFNADTAAHLYTFSETSFVGETFLPLFNVCGKGSLIIH
ncbi:hypothetical protein JRQ81_012244 [Phrynocephalus forsythii]|uniref:Zinc finger protein RFP-like n=1 Tax=Phrynocephalus forsythii TaxID=171643 RepID=A0A9Q0X5I5_9SAUR|nr:hypothetical protein JRQ81_012244 [Phrynocephalus forsythii]